MYYKEKEIEILEIFDQFQNDSNYTIDDLKVFYNNTKTQNFKQEQTITGEELYCFMRYEQYWVLLVKILNGLIKKEELKRLILIVKGKSFIERTKNKWVNKTKNIDLSNKTTVYFDNNTYIYLKEFVPINDISDKYQFIYSPAHAEELANSIRDKNFEYNKFTEGNLKYLSDLTNDCEVLPSQNNGLVIRQEAPIHPLERVINGFDGTLISEDLEKSFLENRMSIRKELSIKNNIDIKGSLNSTVAKMLLKDNSWYSEYENLKDKKVFWNKYKSNYDFLFSDFLGVSRIIDILDKKPESTKKYRSHLHDESHLIYATKCDIFVTNDSKLYDKASEIYNYFSINTKVIKYEDLIEVILNDKLC